MPKSLEREHLPSTSTRHKLGSRTDSCCHVFATLTIYYTAHILCNNVAVYKGNWDRDQIETATWQALDLLYPVLHLGPIESISSLTLAHHPLLAVSIVSRRSRAGLPTAPTGLRALPVAERTSRVRRCIAPSVRRANISRSRSRSCGAP